MAPKLKCDLVKPFLERPKMSEQPKVIKIDTPEGEIVGHEVPIEEKPRTIVRVKGKHLKWLRSLGKNVGDFIHSYSPDLPATEEVTLKHCDQAFRAWQLARNPSHEAEDVIEILGGYLGNKCVDGLDMEWITITDEYGSDYGVRSRTAELMGFPFSTVYKRIEDGEHDFLHGVYALLSERLNSGEHKLRAETNPDVRTSRMSGSLVKDDNSR